MKQLVLLAVTLAALPSACFSNALKPSAAHARAFRDPGVDVGIVKSVTALFSAPDAASGRIGPLKPGAWTVLVSRQVTNDWLNVIDLASGRQGWVRAIRLKVRYTHHPNRGVDLPTEAMGTDAPPSITVKNKSNQDMYLHIGSEPEILIGPNSDKNVSLAPGVWSFNASAANVIPLFGDKAFLTGDRYTWSFRIGDPADSKVHHPVDPNLRAEARQLQTEVDSENANLKVDKQLLDAEETALDNQSNKLQSDQTDVETKRQTLDKSDQALLDSFNNLVDTTNNELEEYREARQRYNKHVVDHNARLDALQAKENRLEQIADIINHG